MIIVTFLRRVSIITLVVALVSIVFFALIIGKGANAQSIPACTDSDSTPDYYGLGPEQVSSIDDNSKYISGTISAPTPNGIQRNEMDVCEASNKVREHFCDRGLYFGYIILDCPNGCSDRACIEESVEELKPEECTDSDGGRDYFVKGETADFGDTREDACLNSKTLTEFYCEQAKGQTRPSRGAEQTKCEYGCKDGACLEGPSEDELARIERQKQIQTMLNGISGMSGLLRGVNVMEKAFQQVAKDGVATPAELAQTITRVKEIRPEIVKLQNRKAESVSDEEAEMLTDNMNELCESGLTLEEWGGQLPQFLQLGAKMKQVSKDLKRAKSDVKLAVKVAARSKFGLSNKVEELNGAIEALKTTLDDAIASDDLNEKNGKINEFYDLSQDIYDTIGVINALQNVQKARTEWGKRVNENARAINQLKRAKFDVTELVVMNDEVKAKLDELKAALAKKPIDRDEVKGLFEDLKVFQSEFVDLADQLRGVKSALPKVKAAKIDTTQFKNFGAFSQFCGVPQQNDNGEEIPEN